MRIVVTGGRDFLDRQFVFSILDEYLSSITCLIVGGARGADTLAEEWAKSRDIPYEVYKADWNKFRKAAGPIRNIQMIEEGLPDLCIAFPGGNGTKHMKKSCEKRMVEVREYDNRLPSIIEFID